MPDALGVNSRPGQAGGGRARGIEGGSVTIRADGMSGGL